jgi:hypothetical protein
MSNDATVKGGPLQLADLELDGIAEALADELQDAIRLQPGSRWNRTGTLLAGIRSNGADVVVPADHLTRDPELAQRFADDVMPENPTTDARVRAAAERAALEAVLGKRR